MSIDLSSLKDLPAAGKLRIVTELWNDIAASNEPVVVPEADDLSSSVLRLYS